MERKNSILDSHLQIKFHFYPCSNSFELYRHITNLSAFLLAISYDTEPGKCGASCKGRWNIRSLVEATFRDSFFCTELKKHGSFPAEWISCLVYGVI